MIASRMAQLNNTVAPYFFPLCRFIEIFQSDMLILEICILTIKVFLREAKNFQYSIDWDAQIHH